MGRTNTVILAIGLFACIALALMMQHVTKVQVEAKRHPAEKEIEQFYGSRLADRPTFAVVDRDGEQVGVLRIRPKLAIASQRLAQSMGRLLWALESVQHSEMKRLEITILTEGEEPRVEVLHRPRVRILRAKPGR